MKSLSRLLLKCSILILAPVDANAAGTYYTGNYQSPQTSYASRTQSASAKTRYNNTSSSYAKRATMGSEKYKSGSADTKQQKAKQSNTSGFWLNGGFSRQVAMWEFEMKNAGSKLHYDNIDWNVLDINGGYKFNAGSVAMQVTAGFQYGFQSGDSNMNDDDITNGGWETNPYDVTLDDGTTYTGVYAVASALSTGTSSGGNMMGFNLGLGLTDFFKVGNVRMTPSVGYRYFKYKLETKNGYGLAVEYLICEEFSDGETQCEPLLVTDSGGNLVGDTFYFHQNGTSHSYEVEWSGPYLALDVDYQINQNNAVNGRIELGLPAYTSTGNQPYRYDWQHPKSVEDSAGIGSAYHLGLGGNWTTALSNSVSLSIGVTYDYYTVSDADAKTYLNSAYYTELYDERLYLYGEDDQIVKNIAQLKEECPGWVCSDNSEVKSFYKSLGVRVGINAKF